MTATDEPSPERQAPKAPRGHRLNWYKAVLFLFSLIIFILAMLLMREGAGELAPLVEDRFALSSAGRSLGFGWIFSYVVMSGSPVAAAALTFLDAGIIDGLGTLTMITGSRLGASFIVLFVGFLYVLRGRDWANSLGIGILALMVTGITHLMALPPGIFLLRSGWLEWVPTPQGILLNSLIDRFFNPIIGFLAAFLPSWTLFIAGILIIIVSFRLFDRSLPQMSLRQSQVGRLEAVVYRPWVMFFLGATITLISMSVSVSLGILVPLSERGFIRRENVIPYIMGANITTFIDTLLAAVLIDNRLGFTVVFIEMVSMMFVSILILALGYHTFERLLLSTVKWLTASDTNLVFFAAFIVLAPLLLLLI